MSRVEARCVLWVSPSTDRVSRHAQGVSVWSAVRIGAAWRMLMPDTCHARDRQAVTEGFAACTPVVLALCIRTI